MNVQVCFSSGCTWCPLDKTCYIVRNSKNPCSKDLKLNSTGENWCLKYDNTNYEYNEKLEILLTKFSVVAYADPKHANTCLNKLIPENTKTTKIELKTYVATKCNIL
ncbi:hypothetical protein DPMN_095658 [Dreissena polymorpha]|uniref:Uncharacterized protein n=1 Tax=Dreissena polymorpha TaxID=45954 RepID=A0A9D4L9W0_DREPO|nr:hypothetical protein DPMN_095658 [Dreissena polymorpha]